MEAEKIALIKQILQLEDEEVFTRLRGAVRKSLQLTSGPKSALPPFSDEEVGRQLREARQQAAAGDVLDVAEVGALAQRWRLK